MSGTGGVGSQLVTGGCEDGGEVGPPLLQPVISHSPHAGTGAGAVAARSHISESGKRRSLPRSPCTDSRPLCAGGGLLELALQSLPVTPSPRSTPHESSWEHCVG